MITLRPCAFSDSVHHIDYQALWREGFRALIFDIDNTLEVFDTKTPSKATLKLLSRLKTYGFKVCLLSNNSLERVRVFNEGLRLPAIHKAGKPRLKGVMQAIGHFKKDGIGRAQVALIGDQLFTDILAGNRLKIHTILTRPIAQRDEWTVKLKRIPEKIILKRMRR